jgi:hypothetical protein
MKLYDDLKKKLDSGMNIILRKYYMKIFCKQKQQAGNNSIMLLYNHNVPIPREYIDQYENMFVCENENDFFELLYKVMKLRIGKINKMIKAYDAVYVLGFEYRYEYASVILSYNTINEFKMTLDEYLKISPQYYCSALDELGQREGSI